jgi:hypothetical protein
MALRSTGKEPADDFDVASIIHGFVPGWSLGSARLSARAAPDATSGGGESALVPRAGGEAAGARAHSRGDDGAEADDLPARPVVEVEGIVPDWLGQVHPGACLLPSCPSVHASRL